MAASRRSARASTPAPLVVAASTTIKAMAVHSGSLTSAVASGAFTISSTTQISYVQSNYATPQTTADHVPVKYSTAQLQGDLNVVVVGWNDATVAVSAVTDTSGNTYAAGGRSDGDQRHRDAVDLLRQQYRGRRRRCQHGDGAVQRSGDRGGCAHPRVQRHRHHSPLDASVGAINSSGTIVSSGAATTTNANDLIIGANLTTGDTAGPGPGFTARMITVPDADIVEDMTVSLGRQLLGDRGAVLGRAHHHADGGLQGGRYGCRQPADRARPTLSPRPPERRG